MTITDRTPGTDLTVWTRPEPAKPEPRAHPLLAWIGSVGFLAVFVAICGAAAYVIVTGGR